jgi:hypothetical protein
MSEIRSVVSKPAEVRVWDAAAAEAWYAKWPTFRCKVVRVGAKSCGRIVPGFPGMDASPCPECSQRTPDGKLIATGMLVKIGVEELEPALFPA